MLPKKSNWVSSSKIARESDIGNLNLWFANIGFHVKKIEERFMVGLGGKFCVAEFFAKCLGVKNTLYLIESTLGKRFGAFMSIPVWIGDKSD